MTVAIEKNIPIPQPTRGPTAERQIDKYPLRQMQPGDSFLLQGEEAKRAVQSIYNWGAELKMKFSYRKVDGNSFRIWRTA